MENILDRLTELVIVFNKEGIIEFCNNKVISMTKLNKDEIINSHIDETLICDDFSFNNITKDNLNKEYIFKLRTYSNQEIEVSGEITQDTWKGTEAYFAILNEYNKIVISNTEITKKLEKEITRRRDVEKELDMLLATGIDFSAMIDLDGNFIRIALGWNVILGWTKEDLRKEKWYGLIHPDEIKEAINVLRIGKRSKKVSKGVNRYKCKNGGYRTIKWRAMYLEERNMYVASATDITEELRLEKERRRLEKKFQSESIKNEFFANMSHEFKTPLNIILAAIQLVELGIDKGDIVINNSNMNLTKYIHSVKQNSYRLLRLVNNIIDSTRIGTGYYNLKLENLNIVSVVENIITSVVEYIEGKGIEITFDPEVEEQILACDAEKIERIVLNLLSNAIKYSKTQGKIEISLHVDKDVYISVKDNGIGIAEEKLNSIFDRFSRIDSSFTRSVEGSGIGLSLVKSLVEMHGGHVWIKSKEGEGTEVIFSLPINLIENEEVKVYDNKQMHIERCNIEFSDIYDM